MSGCAAFFYRLIEKTATLLNPILIDNITYNPSNIFARARLVKTRLVGEYSPAKTGEYPRIFPNFQNVARCVKDLKDNKDNSLHLGSKYARIFVLGHYLFLVDHSFPRATLSENCSLLGTDNVRGQISEHISAPNGGYCLYIILQQSCCALLRTPGN